MHKITSFLEATWNWLVRSSVDSEKVSLTVKGVLGATATTFIGLLGATHYQVPGLPEALNGVIDQVVTIVQYGLGIVSAISIVVGSVRKIFLTLTGDHSALQ